MANVYTAIVKKDSMKPERGPASRPRVRVAAVVDSIEATVAWALEPARFRDVFGTDEVVNVKANFTLIRAPAAWEQSGIPSTSPGNRYLLRTSNVGLRVSAGRSTDEIHWNGHDNARVDH